MKNRLNRFGRANAVRLGARQAAPALSAVPALCALSLALGAAAHAQPIELNPVVVTGARMAQPLADVLPSVSVITRAEIEKSQAPTLADLLQGEAGFEFGRNGGPGTVTSFFMRGQDSRNVVLMVDGVRAQTDGMGSLQVTDLPLQQVERVEILRGNASALYGESAIGGVIQVFTRKGQGAPRAYGSVGMGSQGTRSVHAGYGGTAGGYSFDLNAGQEQSAGFSAINTAQVAVANPDRDSHRKQSFAARVEKQLDGDLSLGLRVSSRRSQVNYDEGGWGAAPADTHRGTSQSDVLGVFARKAIGDHWTSTLDVSRSELSSTELKNGVPYAAGDGSYRSGHFAGTQNALRWFNTYQWTKATVANFGLDRNDEMFSAQGDYAYRMARKTSGTFAGLTHTWQALTGQLNVRRDAVDVTQADAWSAAASEVRQTTGLLGLAYQLTPKWRASAATSTGFAAPTAFDVAGNPTLKAETHKSAEMGLTYATASTVARLVYFNTSTQDAHMYDDASFKTLNIGQARNKGIEATVRSQWMGNAVKLSAVSQNPWSVSYNEPLARRARQHASADVSRPVGSYNLGVKVQANGQRKDSHYNPGVMLAGYATASLYASRKVGDDWTARVRLDNAFDKQYQLAHGYNTAGRGLFATLHYSPK